MPTKTQTTTIAIIAALLGAAGIAATNQQPQQLTNAYSTTTGLITYNIEATYDPQQTSKVTHINWGTLSPNQTRTITLYITTQQNNTRIALGTSNHTPPQAAQYLILTWNYDGAPLTANTPKQVNLSLHIEADTQNITNFSFTITIYTL